MSLVPRYVLIVLLTTLGTSIARADPPPSSLAPSAALYDSLVARLRSGDTNVDYTALRLSYPLTDHYDPYCSQSRGLFGEAWKAMQAKNCKTVFAKTDELLKVNFVDVDSHAFRSSCYEDAGDKANEDLEDAIGRGVLRSLFASGDGKAPQTAYQVVSLNEEGMVMARFGAREEQQSLISDNGHSYDLLSGKNEKTGEAVSLYFNIDLVFGSLNKMFDKSKTP